MSAGNSHHWGMPWGFSVPASTPLGVQSAQIPGWNPTALVGWTVVVTGSLTHLFGFSSFPVLFFLDPHPILTSWDHFRITCLCPCSGSAPVHAVCLVTQSCPTPCDPVDCSPPGSSVRGILQAAMLEWVAIPFSRGSSQPRDQTCVSCISGIAGGFLTAEPPGNLWSVLRGTHTKTVGDDCFSGARGLIRG